MDSLEMLKKITEMHSKTLAFYSSEKLTEREMNLLRSEMKNYLELIASLKSKHNVGIESSYQHEDKEKKFPEYLVAVATYVDDSTETIGTFEPTNNIDSLKVELDGFCERINELF